MISKELRRVLVAAWGKELVTLIVILLLVVLMPQPTWYQAWLLYSIPIVFITWRGTKTLKQLMIIAVVLFAFYNINKVVLWGAALLIVLFILYRLYKDIKRDKQGKSLYLTGLRDIETRLYGKPLEKKHWEEKK